MADNHRNTFNLTEVNFSGLDVGYVHEEDKWYATEQYPKSKASGDDFKNEMYSGLEYCAEDNGSRCSSESDDSMGSSRRSCKRVMRTTQFSDEEASCMMDIMMLLDIDKVPALRKEFEAKAEGLTMADFVRVMMKYLKRSELDEHQLVSNLCELFAQIDVNGDGTMEWDEFTSFIVDTGNLAIENEPNSIQKYNVSPWYDDAKHSGIIEHVYYFGGNVNNLATCEANSHALRLYHAESLELESSIELSKGSVLCAEHLKDAGQLALSSSSLSISLFDETNHRLTRTFTTDTSQICLEWAPELFTLFSAGVNGIIHAWDVVGGRESHCMGGVVQNGKSYLMSNSHTDMVQDLLQISSLGSLASASMDHTIKLWDMATGKHKKTLEGHVKGVRNLAYSSEYRFMVSAGFDFDAYVWNPYVEHLILRLSGHNAPLCKVDMIEDTPQIVTADVSGIFKVWDIRNFGCVQTFSTESCDLLDFCAVTPHKTLVGCGRRLHHFEYEMLKNLELTDDLPVFKAILNPTTMTLLTASGCDVRLWDARKGTLMNRFRGLCGGRELCCVCLDDRERKFIVGDHKGHITVFDYISGTAMKEFAYPDCAHISEVSNVIYCNEYKIVISAGWDDTIMLHDEIDPEQGILLRKMHGGHHGSDITALAFSHKLGIIASGSTSQKAPIVLWGFEFGRIEAVLNPDIISISSSSSRDNNNNANVKSSSPSSRKKAGRYSGGSGKGITALCFMDKTFPGLVSADGGGGVTFWAIKPAREWCNRLLCRIVNRNENENSAVSVLCVDENTRKLYAADEAGCIKVWDYSSLEKKAAAKIGGDEYKPVQCENPRRKIYIDVTTQNEMTEANAAFKAAREAVAKGKKNKGGTEGKEESSDNSNGVNFNNSKPTAALFRVGSVVTPEESWKAHSDTILSLQLVTDRERPCLISASHDCFVRIFSLKGQLLGTLHQGENYGGLNWGFKIDVTTRRRMQFEQAQSILEEIEDIDDSFDAQAAADEDDLLNLDDIGDGVLALTNSSKGAAAAAAVRHCSGSSINSATPTLTDSYTRKTPRLMPIGAKLAGRGLSNSLKGKRYRSAQRK